MIHRSGEAVLHFPSLGTAKRIAANPGKFTRVQIVSSLARLSDGREYRVVCEGTLAACGRRTLINSGIVLVAKRSKEQRAWVGVGDGAEESRNCVERMIV
jgi:hypothetical protein